MRRELHESVGREGGGDAYQTVSQSLQGGLLHRNVQLLRGGLVFKAHILCVSLNSRLESNKAEKKV